MQAENMETEGSEAEDGEKLDLVVKNFKDRCEWRNLKWGNLR